MWILKLKRRWFNNLIINVRTSCRTRSKGDVVALSEQFVINNTVHLCQEIAYDRVRVYTVF